MNNSDHLFSGPCRFVMGVTDLAQLPQSERPEAAFIGRSNVGKSSLINALTNNARLAHASRTPGRTQQLNFFSLRDTLHLVDMPGYGFARVPAAQKEAWDGLIRGYLRGRQSLRCVFVLIDARHGLKESDCDMMALLDSAAVPFGVVLTKADKVSAAAQEVLRAALGQELSKHPAARPEIIFTSMRTKAGIADLRALIAGMM